MNGPVMASTEATVIITVSVSTGPTVERVATTESASAATVSTIPAPRSTRDGPTACDWRPGAPA